MCACLVNPKQTKQTIFSNQIDNLFSKKKKKLVGVASERVGVVLQIIL